MFNIKETCADEDDPLLVILAEVAFVFFSTTNSPKCYIPGQLVFGHDMILLIKHKVDQKLIRQRKQRKIHKDNICKNNKRVDHAYKVGDNFIITNKYAYIYETPYNGPFLMTQCWTNGTVTLQSGPEKKL